MARNFIKLTSLLCLCSGLSFAQTPGAVAPNSLSLKLRGLKESSFAISCVYSDSGDVELEAQLRLRPGEKFSNYAASGSQLAILTISKAQSRDGKINFLQTEKPVAVIQAELLILPHMVVVMGGDYDNLIPGFGDFIIDFTSKSALTNEQNRNYSLDCTAKI